VKSKSEVVATLECCAMITLIGGNRCSYTIKIISRFRSSAKVAIMQTLRCQGTCVHRVGINAKCAFTARRSTVSVRHTLRDLRVRAEEETVGGEIEVRLC
jgi:hypothetical protein